MMIFVGSMTECGKAISRFVFGVFFGFALLGWATAGLTQPASPMPNLVPAYTNLEGLPPARLPDTFVPGSRSQPKPQPVPSGAVPSVGQQASLAIQQLSCTPPPAANEIVELARALKWNPDLIYEYVRNNIKTIPIYDSLKGALGALLDGAGTPVDQAELNFTLLQQSCFSPQYQVGLIFLSSARLDLWLGTDASTFGNTGQYYSVVKIFSSNGFCTSIASNVCLGLQVYTSGGSPTGHVFGADIPWIWVSVPINGTTYLFDPASKIFPNDGGDGYYPYSNGLGANLATALGYDQASFLNGARSGAGGIGTPALTFSQAGRSNVRNSLALFANNLANYIGGANASNPVATTTDVIGGSNIQFLPTYTPPASGDTLWGQTALLYPNIQNIPPTATASLSAFRTTLTLTLGWNDSNNAFIQLANPVIFNSADIHGRRLSVQFSAAKVASLLLEGVTRATASGAVPLTNQLTARVAIFHPHMPCNSLPTPSGCPGGPGPNIDNVRVTPAPNEVFIVGNAWGGSSRGVIERHRRQLRKNLMDGQSATSEAVLGESLAMIGSTWLAEYTRHQFVSGQLGGALTTYFHAVGISGMKPVASSLGPYVDLPLNTLGVTQKISRPPFSTSVTPIESSVFFTVGTVGSVLESAVIEQTQAKDLNGQPAVAASTMKLLDVWSTAGTIYNLNDATIVGDDCSYYAANIRSNLVNFNAPDKAGIEKAIGYNSNTNTCSTPASTSQVIVPSNGQIAIGLWNGTGYLQVFRGQNQTDITGIGAFITGGLSGGESGSPLPPEIVNGNQSTGPPLRYRPTLTTTIVLPKSEMEMPRL